jgi:hypothetical protein
MSATSTGMLIKCRVRKRVLAVAKEWSLCRQRIPRSLIETLEKDFDKQLTTTVLSLLQHTPQKRQSDPKTPRKTSRTAKQEADD